jgi:putative methyltransferase (TIGR04325 family)
VTEATEDLKRIRRLSAALCRLQSAPLGAALVQALRQAPVMGAMLRRGVGFRGAFASAQAARAAAAGVVPLDQDHASNVTLHQHLSHSARPSDAAAMEALRPLVAEPITLVDLGGNAGNLYYLYRQHLTLHPGMRWLVHDLPGVCAAGAQIAADAGAAQLAFDPDPGVVRRADVLLCSGVLHYFEETLAEMLQRIDARPAVVVANRTPLAPRARTYTVQDAGDFFALCVLHTRDDLLTGMSALGYRLEAEWPAPDLRLDVPAWPEHSVTAYAGFVWRRG